MVEVMSFEKAIEFTLKWEGGYSNDPTDPGGETKYGISKRAHPDLDIANLTLEDAKDIYRAEYWDASGCNNLSEPFDMVVFDAAVNMGIRRSKSLLTIAKGWQDYLFLRLERYISMREQYPQFIFGWVNRVMNLWKVARDIEA
jgi:lysozyme family protein